MRFCGRACPAFSCTAGSFLPNAAVLSEANCRCCGPNAPAHQPLGIAAAATLSFALPALPPSSAAAPARPPKFAQGRHARSPGPLC